MARRQRLPTEPLDARIDDLSHDGRGVARVDGKVVFIHGALPGEDVRFKLTGRRKDFDWGETVEVLSPSPHRVDPKCPHFDRCGGCSLQHLETTAQIRFKQATLAENLKRIGGVEPDAWLDPLTGPSWGYRRKARLGVKAVPGKGRVLVGFRERNPRFVAEMDRCEVLIPSVGEQIDALAAAIDQMDARDRIAQIEVAADDERTILVVRHLDPLSEADLKALRDLAEALNVSIWLQPKGPQTVHPHAGSAELLEYSPEAGLSLEFAPLDFVQINADINRQMVARAIAELELEREHRVLDLFCGLGNFSLPLARRCAEVVGIEGEAELVRKAERNAERNAIDNASFVVADLTEPPTGTWAQRPFDRVLLDPPRSGAEDVLLLVAGMGAQRIVYVSCHPGSLARDAGELVRTHGYRLLKAGVMDMFPHTAHVESMAVFARSA